jgi:hypothetical protein
MPKCGDSDEPDPVKGFMTGLSEPHGKSNLENKFKNYTPRVSKLKSPHFQAYHLFRNI